VPLPCVLRSMGNLLASWWPPAAASSATMYACVHCIWLHTTYTLCWVLALIVMIDHCTQAMHWSTTERVAVGWLCKNLLATKHVWLHVNSEHVCLPSSKGRKVLTHHACGGHRRISPSSDGTQVGLRGSSHLQAGPTNILSRPINNAHQPIGVCFPPHHYFSPFLAKEKNIHCWILWRSEGLD
jgi:hypothetical protein